MRSTAKGHRVRIRNVTRNRVLAEFAEVADSSSTRRKGLLGRDYLAPGDGLWIVPCESIHTWAMKFVIDVIYLDRERRIRKLRRQMAPWRMSICLPAHSVLELPAGTIADTGSCVGDRLDLAFWDWNDLSCGKIPNGLEMA